MPFLWCCLDRYNRPCPGGTSVIAECSVSVSSPGPREALFSSCSGIFRAGDRGSPALLRQLAPHRRHHVRVVASQEAQTCQRASPAAATFTCQDGPTFACRLRAAQLSPRRAIVQVGCRFGYCPALRLHATGACTTAFGTAMSAPRSWSLHLGRSM